MFSGLIREIAKVNSFQNSVLTLSAEYTPNIGDSVSINGACLTVISLSNKTFAVELSPESSKLLAIENYKDEVHIEPAMQMGDRFEGHVVQGHIDIIGSVKDIQKFGNSYNLFIEIEKEYLRLIAPKGSIAIDGVSLTVNEIIDNIIRLTIIPHTMENTIFKNYKIGTRLNIESDMFLRYIENIQKHKTKKSSWKDIDLEMAQNY